MSFLALHSFSVVWFCMFLDVNIWYDAFWRSEIFQIVRCTLSKIAMLRFSLKILTLFKQFALSTNCKYWKCYYRATRLTQPSNNIKWVPRLDFSETWGSGNDDHPWALAGNKTYLPFAMSETLNLNTYLSRYFKIKYLIEMYTIRYWLFKWVTHSRGGEATHLNQEYFWW